MMSTGRNKFPFTASQWQELEHQALVFKYMISGMPIPPDLLYTIRRSLDSSLSSKLMLHQPHQPIGWNCFQMDFGRKIDPEPGRCRRTDGKKWRCSKEAYPDSKYCERHMHRGRNRSRKPVEVMTPITTTTTANNTSTRLAPTAIPISSITNKDSLPFAYPHSSSSRPPGLSFSSQDNTTNFLLESSPYSPAGKDNRNSYGHGIKEVVGEHSFLSDASVSMRSTSVEDSWNLTMGGSPLGQHLYNQRDCSGLQSSGGHQQQQPSYNLQLHQSSLLVDDHKPKKVMHHFFDEWPPKNKDSWLDSEDKLSINDASLSKTHLSISMPNSARDFFITQNDK